MQSSGGPVEPAAVEVPVQQAVEPAAVETGYRLWSQLLLWCNRLWGLCPQAVGPAGGVEGVVPVQQAAGAVEAAAAQAVPAESLGKKASCLLQLHSQKFARLSKIAKAFQDQGRKTSAGAVPDVESSCLLCGRARRSCKWEVRSARKAIRTKKEAAATLVYVVAFC